MQCHVPSCHELAWPDAPHSARERIPSFFSDVEGTVLFPLALEIPINGLEGVIKPSSRADWLNCDANTQNNADFCS